MTTVPESDLEQAVRWVRWRLPSHLHAFVLSRLEGSPASAEPAYPPALVEAIQRVIGEVADPVVWLEAQLEARRARAGGMAKARQHSRALKIAGIERHTWKIPLDSPDFVERVLEHFARSGEVAPSCRFIRRWRAQQLSARQHNARKTS